MAEPRRESYDMPDSGATVADTEGTSELKESDLGAVLEDIHDAHSKWYGIGLQLGLVPNALEGIKDQCSNSAESLREMLRHWLKLVSPVPTWVALIEALRSKTVNEPKLADQLEEKHQILTSISPTPSSASSLSGHGYSNITDRHKQLLGLKDQLQFTTKEVETQLENYELLQQREKAINIPSKGVAELPEATPERQLSQSDADRIRIQSDKAVQIQLRELKNRIASLEDKEAQRESRVPDEVMISELDSLKDEMYRLRILNSELEEKIALLTKEKEDLINQRHSLIEENIEKDKEIAAKASNLAKKSEDYKMLLEKMQQVENERNQAQKEAVELQKLIKTQSLDEMQPPPQTSESTTKTAAV